MNVDEVKLAVQKINDMRDDDEAAHGNEDDLHRSVLRAIAEGSPVAQELAKEALKTLDIDFSRWCA